MKQIFIISKSFLVIIFFFSCDQAIMPSEEPKIFCHEELLPKNVKLDSTFYIKALRNGIPWTSHLYCFRKYKWHNSIDGFDLRIYDHDSCESLIFIDSRNFLVKHNSKDSLSLELLGGYFFKSSNKDPICEFSPTSPNFEKKNYFTLDSDYSDTILTGKFNLELSCERDTFRFQNGTFRVKVQKCE